MKSKRQYKYLQFQEYFHLIANRKRYTDFNTLGLFRSILENTNLSAEERIQLREHVKTAFAKTYEFLQLKDPVTFVELELLGREKTEEMVLWNEVKANQARILKEKRLGHRNIGVFSKHQCGYEQCPLNGVMVQKGSWFAQTELWLHTDRNHHTAKLKSKRLQKEKKQFRNRVRLEMQSDQAD